MNDKIRTTTAKRFGTTLKAARAAHGVTQHGLEESTGISRPAIARYEAGAACPSLADALILARKLEFSLDDLG